MTMMDNITAPPPAATCHRETADNYDRVVLVLNDRWRIIECKDGIQWIVQQRNSAVLNSPAVRWRNRYHHRLRHTLITAVGRLPVDLTWKQLQTLNGLPDACGRAQ